MTEKFLSGSEKKAVAEDTDFYARLYDIPRRYNLTHQDAEDITQEAFLLFFRHDVRKREWLITITINLTLKFLKRRRFYPVLASYVDEQADYLEPWALADQKNTFRIVWDAIMIMKEAYRTAIVLRYFEDLSVKEIARILEISENAVRIRLYRGREFLKSFLL